MTTSQDLNWQNCIRSLRLGVSGTALPLVCIVIFVSRKRSRISSNFPYIYPAILPHFTRVSVHNSFNYPLLLQYPPHQLQLHSNWTSAGHSRLTHSSHTGTPKHHHISIVLKSFPCSYITIYNVHSDQACFMNSTLHAANPLYLIIILLTLSRPNPTLITNSSADPCVAHCTSTVARFSLLFRTFMVPPPLPPLTLPYSSITNYNVHSDQAYFMNSAIRYLLPAPLYTTR